MTELRPFSSRLKWVASTVAVSFGIEFDRAALAIARDSKLWDALLSGEGPARMFVFYQPPDKWSDDGECVAGTGAPELISTLGHTTKLRGRACYFLRTSINAPVDSTKVRHRHPLVTLRDCQCNRFSHCSH
jgi:hypothetical protein